MDCTIYVTKTRVLNRCAVTAQLICGFVFVYAKTRFSNDATQISNVPVNNCSVMSGLELTLPRYGE